MGDGTRCNYCEAVDEPPARRRAGNWNGGQVPATQLRHLLFPRRQAASGRSYPREVQNARDVKNYQHKNGDGEAVVQPQPFRTQLQIELIVIEAYFPLGDIDQLIEDPRLAAESAGKEPRRPAHIRSRVVARQSRPQ